MTVKRLNYYTNQFLQEQDFKDEQQYHMEMRRLHNRIFHSWGVAEGLEVHRKSEHEITITAGVAIDNLGREIVLAAPVTRVLGSEFGRDANAFVTIAYEDIWDETDHHTSGGVEGYTRATESALIEEKKKQPAADGAVITLARVHLNDAGHVGEPDMGTEVRKLARASNPDAGWMRVAFKPVNLNPVRSEGRLVRVVSAATAEEYEFIVDEANAYCDEKGARGSMGIPVPPGATRVTGLRIAGTTRGEVTVHLFRTGWNVTERKGEKKALFEETQKFAGANFHHHHLAVNAELDETHTLALSVIAQGETSIWLVAARFE